jgi:hypothetical protein
MGPRIALLVICILLATHATVSWLAVRGKSATADEPAHLAAAVVQVRHLDFRADRESPPLWKYWAGLPHLFSRVNLDPANSDWYWMPQRPGVQFGWATDILYRTPGNDADALLARSRAMMLLIVVALGALIARWAWQLGGPTAAVVATALFALDPNFLGHGPLVKNDVAFAFAWTAVAYATCRVGRRLNAATMFLLACTCGLALLIKFSALLVLPMVASLLCVRSVLPFGWEAAKGDVAERSGESTLRRLALAVGVIVTVCVIAYLLVWAGYGFRYYMTPGFRVTPNWNELLARAARHNASDDPGLFAATVREAAKLKIVPEAWANGLLFTHVSMYGRRSYLLGEFSDSGWWYYFPFTILVKTPLATMGAAAAALAIVVTLLLKKTRFTTTTVWDFACVLIPAALYLAVAMNAAG